MARTVRGFAPFLQLIVAILAVSCSSILIRLTHSSPLVIAFYRQLFSAVLLLPFVQSNPDGAMPQRNYRLLIVSGLFLALHFATWITGLSYTTVARATLFVDLQPIWAAILGRILLQESLVLGEVVGIALVTVGGVVSVGSHWSQGGAGLLGDFLAVAGGIAGAGYFLIGRKMRLQISWLHYMFLVYLFSAGWLLLFQVCLFRTFPLPADRDIFWILAMALIPSLVGHGLFNLAIRRLKAYVVNAAFLGEPMIATILAYFLFGEQPDPWYYIGAPIVFIGLILIFVKQRQPIPNS